MNRPVILYIAASLDGFIARRDGSVNWLPLANAEEDFGYAEFYGGVDTALMGRKTYDLARELEGPTPFSGKRCVVFSRRRAGQRDRRTVFTADDPADTVRRLREQRGGGIWLVGGGEIVRECFEAGVINEVILSLVPVVLGDGVPLFLPRAGTTWLQLRKTRAYANGLVQLTYGVGTRPRARVDEEPRAVALSEVADSRAATGAVGAEMVRAWALRASAA